MLSTFLRLCVIYCVLFPFHGMCQNTWVKSFNGFEGGALSTISIDYGSCIITDKDGTSVISGSNSNAMSSMYDTLSINYDVFINKIDENGNVLWKKRFGGTKDDGPVSLLKKKDGSYLLIGNTYSNDGIFSGMNNGSWDIFIMNIASDGKILWNKTFGAKGEDIARSAVLTFDEHIILTGNTTSDDGIFNGQNRGHYDIMVMKITKQGNLEWLKTIGGSDRDFANAVNVSTIDQSIVLTGSTASTDSDFTFDKKNQIDIITLKMNATGEVQWVKRFGGRNTEEGESIIVRSDNSIIFSGFSWSQDGDFINQERVFAQCLDQFGNSLWRHSLNGPSIEGIKTIIKESEDGTVFLAGCIRSLEGQKGIYSDLIIKTEDIFLLALDAKGSRKWIKNYGGSKEERCADFTINQEKVFFLIGMTNSFDDVFSYRSSHQDPSDAVVLKIDAQGNLNNTTSINEYSEPPTTLSVHPNPFSNSTTISYKVDTPSNVRIELLNTLGQTIEVLREDYTDIGTYQLPINVSTLTSGMYSVKMRSGSFNKVVLVWVVR